MQYINIDNITIEIIRKNIKNLHLYVFPPDGKVRISAPLSTTDEAIRLFVISKFGWIKRNQRNFKDQLRETPRDYKSRESHFFNGKRYLLELIEHDSPPKVVIKNNSYILMYVRFNTSPEKRNEIMNEWYRSQLKKLIPEIINKWEKIIGVSVSQWGIKQMKTKWGSCIQHKQKIWINLELAKKPFHCLEYIIVHEMVHILEKNHNENFIQYMNKFLPQWKKLKNELNKFPLSHTNWKY